MLFSQKNDKKDATKSSLLGTLFNPRLGDDIKPLVQETRMFVRLLAIVLAGCNLFPQNHPALLDEKAPLSFVDVIRVSWSRLSFTRDGIPQIVLFVAVWGCLIFSALFVITLIFSLFATPAHADDSIFTSPATNDWGIDWIKYLFLGEAISISGLSDAAVSGCSMQTAIGAMLSFYSSAILVLAGIILLYHLTTMIVDTARTGKFMGEANQVWAPIRLVIAIGLLVPIATSSGSSSSCNVGGYNTAQYIVIKVAEMGSGLASHGWALFLDALNNADTTSSCTTGSPSCAKTNPQSRQFAQSMIENYACALIYNDELAKIFGDAAGSYANAGDAAGSVLISEGNPITTTTTVSTDGKAIIYNFGASESEKLRYCGGISVLPIPTGDYQSVYKAQLKVVNTYLPKFKVFAAKVYSYYANTTSDRTTTLTNMAEGEKLVSSFESDITSAISSSLSSADTTAKGKIGGTSADSVYKDTGWLAAGAWFNTIARIQAERSGSMHNAIPSAIPPDLNANSEKDSKSLKTVKDRAAKGFKQFTQDLDYKIVSASLSSVAEKAETGTPKKGFWRRLFTKANPVNIALNLIDSAGSTFGLWDDEGTFMITFDKTQNPLWELAAFGQNFVEAATWCLSGAGGASLLDVFILDGDGQNIITSILTSVAILFFVLGFFIGFLVPLFPFFRFFFGALTWIVTVFEAMVGMPLFALAHLTPYGNGLLGNGGAKKGYFQMLQILLRPTLMILGLAAGFVLFNIAITTLNTMFKIAAIGTGNLSGGTPAIGRLAYSVIYCGLVYVCANKCFQTIGLFPQTAMSWIGGQAHEERMGDAAVIQAVAGGVLTRGLQGAAPALTQGPAKAIASSKGKAKTKAGEAESKRRHEETVGVISNIGSGAGGGQQANLTKPEEKTPGYTKDEKTNLLLSNTTSTKTEEMHKAYDDGTNSGLGNRGRTVFGENGQPKTPGGGGGRSNTDGNKNV